MKKTAQARGFTLVELLVVIAIIAILAVVALVIINPVELTRRGRDAVRLSDLATLQNAITVALEENASVTDFLCGGGTVTSPTVPCSGSSGTDTTDASCTAAGCNGWVKIHLGGQPAVKVSALPRDPTNVSPLLYSYASDGVDWEINAQLESIQYLPKEGTDGGNDTNAYEVGSKLTLI